MTRYLDLSAQSDREGVVRSAVPSVFWTLFGARFNLLRVASSANSPKIEDGPASPVPGPEWWVVVDSMCLSRVGERRVRAACLFTVEGLEKLQVRWRGWVRLL